MLNLLPVPIVYPNFLISSTASQFQVTTLSMAASSRLLPQGTLSYESKTKRVNAVQETFQATKTMDALFSEDQNSTGNNNFDDVIIDQDGVLIRIMIAGGFTNGSFESRKNELPFSKSAQRLLSKMQNLANNNNSATNKNSAVVSSSQQVGNIFDQIEANDKRSKNNHDDDDSSSHSSHHQHYSSATPGLAFVGRVVAAGKNVHFLNEWIPDPGPASILPRGFKEGDLVCGLQCDSRWLRGEPLRGTAGTYAVIPACFVMRMTTTESPQQQIELSPLLLSTISANLLSSVLWYNLLKWHLDPKQDESILFVSVRTKSESGLTLLSPSSCSSLIPAVGAALVSALKFFVAHHESRRFNPVAIISTCEEDTKNLKKFEQHVRKKSKMFGFQKAVEGKEEDDDDDEEQLNSTTTLFEIIEVFKTNQIRKFNHVVISQDENDEHEEKDESNDEENDNSLEKLLFRALAENGTLGVIKNKIKNHQMDPFISSTVLPFVLSKNGRFAFMSTQSLFDSPAERTRRSIVEITSLLLSGDFVLPPPARIIKPDFQKSLEPLARQYKMFLSNSQDQQDKTKTDEQLIMNDVSLFAKQAEWFKFADRTGAIVAETLSKSLGGLSAMLANRKQQRSQLDDFSRFSENGGNQNGDDDDYFSSQQRQQREEKAFVTKRESIRQSNDVIFENGLNSLVIQFPTGELRK